MEQILKKLARTPEVQEYIALYPDSELAKKIRAMEEAQD